MSDRGEPLICDFGISSVMSASISFGSVSSEGRQARGSMRWMAVELFDIGGPHSEKTDVWAFGMTAYVRKCITPDDLLWLTLCRKSSLRNRPTLISKLNLKLCGQLWMVSYPLHHIFPKTRLNARYGISVVVVENPSQEIGRICRKWCISYAMYAQSRLT